MHQTKNSFQTTLYQLSIACYHSSSSSFFHFRTRVMKTQPSATPNIRFCGQFIWLCYWQNRSKNVRKTLMPTELLFYFQISRNPSCFKYNLFFTTITVIIGFMLMKKPTISFDEIVPLKNRHIHHQQKQDCTVNGSISGSVSREEAGAKLLENLGLFNINWSLSRWDSKHLYKFLDFIWPGNKFLELSKKCTVSIATQRSLEKLHSILEVSRHWTGPISLAVFVAGEEFPLTELYISYLSHCFPHVED